jgi:hypothetical protein
MCRASVEVDQPGIDGLVLARVRSMTHAANRHVVRTAPGAYFIRIKRPYSGLGLQVLDMFRMRTESGSRPQQAILSRDHTPVRACIPSIIVVAAVARSSSVFKSIDMPLSGDCAGVVAVMSVARRTVGKCCHSPVGKS